MEGQQRAIALLDGFMSEQELQLLAITAVADTKDVRIDLISSTLKDLSYMGTKPTSTGICCFNLEETQRLDEFRM